MKIISPAFKDNEFMPSVYTCDGDNINPPLNFVDIPDAAVSLALIMDDPDVPVELKPDGHFTHWVVFNISPETTQIKEGQQLPNANYGINDAGTQEYFGPCPPVGYKPSVHRYFFKLYALSAMIDLPSGITQKQLEAAMEPFTIESSYLVGLYSRD